ncbi:hypothetical protein A3K81_01585 [Candidatus Bathyarchaeota archaeon RBG_13_60_20]|nr:MAG: hypothetical protein A3K81_01585 [Candidatus Bathyarchaeota archaeon RBG_13_60_20]
MGSVRVGAAKFISLAFNAPFLAACTFLYVYLHASPRPGYGLMVASAFFSGILPILLILYMKRSGIVSEMMVNSMEDRTRPFLGASLSYLLGAAALRAMSAPPLMVYLMACYLVNTLAMMLITLKYKISIHAAGVAGPSTFLVHQYGLAFWPFLLAAVIVSWARYKLELHTLGQLTWGILATGLLTYVQLELYPLIIPP